jgi:PiT family inorganic phosphate transporter
MLRHFGARSQLFHEFERETGRPGDVGSELLLIIVVVTALAFDFTNGFHDTANAMATSIATGALRPRVAVGLAAVMNLIGAFLSIKVATTIATGIVDANALTLTMVFAALIGAIAWNLVTWALSLPSSSSHALVGGVVGAAIAAIGTGAIKGDTLVEKVIVPAVLSPVIAGLVAIAGTIFAYAMVSKLREGEARRGYRLGQIGSASLVSLAHGTNDAQKTMGVITLALIAHGNLDADNFTVPLWVKVGCGVAIAAGTYIGGWRIINTMGNRLTEIESPQGFAAESSGASVILASSYFGYPLSTTHVVSGAVVGSGVGKRLASVQWGTAGQMASAWLLTIPGAAIIGAAAFEGADVFGKGNVGPVIVGLIVAGLAAVLYVVTQRTPVRANDLDRSRAADEAQSPQTRVAVPA